MLFVPSPHPMVAMRPVVDMLTHRQAPQAYVTSSLSLSFLPKCMECVTTWPLATVRVALRVGEARKYRVSIAMHFENETTDSFPHCRERLFDVL